MGWEELCGRALRVPVKPHTSRAALRMGLGVMVPLIVEALLLNGKDRDEIKSCQWAAVTIVMTAEPMLGQFVKKGVERIMGSLVGGVLAVGVASVWVNPWFFMASATVVVWFAFWQLTFQWGYDYTAKLLAITFCLVLWGVEDNARVLWVAGTRLAGVVGGVLLGMALSVLLSPRTATEEAFEAGRAALRDLRDVSRLAWKTREVTHTWDRPPGVQPRPAAEAAEKSGLLEPLLPPSETIEQAFGQDAEVDMQALIAEIDGKCDSCGAALVRMHAAVKIAQSEYLVGQYRGLLDRGCRPILLGWAPLCAPYWQVPVREFELMAQEVRRVSRILWALHLTFNDNFDEAALARVRRRYPAHLMGQVAESAQAALSALIDSFPIGVFRRDGVSCLPRDRLLGCDPRPVQLKHIVQRFLALSEFEDVRSQHRLRHGVRTTTAHAQPVATVVADPPRISPSPSIRRYFEHRQSFDAAVIAGLLADSSPPLVDEARPAEEGERRKSSAGDETELDGLGYVLTLRWHNLLFIIDELQMDMEDLYDTMDTLLAKLQPERGHHCS